MRSLGVIELILIVLLVFGVAFFVYRTEQKSWASRLSEAAAGAARTVDRFTRQVQDHLALMGALDSGYLRARPEVLDGLLDQIPALLEVIRVDERGRFLVGSYQDAPVMANLFTIPQSTWFAETRRGQPYVGEVQLSAEKEPYLILALPTSDGGAVAARLRIDMLWQVMAEIRFGRTGQAYVIDREGEVVAHPDAGVVLARTSIADQPELQAILLAPDNQWYGQYLNFSGAEVVGSSAAIPGSGWIVLTEISRSEAYAVTGRALLVLGGSALLFGAIMTISASRLMQRAVFGPVEKLRAGAERFGRGDVEHRIPVAQRNEIGQVAEAFNDMADRLHERQVALEQARDEALEASRFKSRLLANVSHDLRTPLNAILGYADMLQEGVYGRLNERQLRSTRRILSNSRRLLGMINSLLDQAQIEAGTLKLRREAFAPSSLVASVENIMRLAAEAKGLALSSEIASDLPSCLVGDPDRIQQVLLNLMENAIKFTPEGTVSLRLYVPGPGYWAAQVCDTGPGIPPDMQGYIFDAFRCGDESTTREQKGVGLGLSIVKQLTLLMGGDVQLDSEMGRGSCFTVRLPLAIPEGEQS
jgi:signal transduction histidine kinase